jgi:hypothetical protein
VAKLDISENSGKLNMATHGADNSAAISKEIAAIEGGDCIV